MEHFSGSITLDSKNMMNEEHTGKGYSLDLPSNRLHTFVGVTISIFFLYLVFRQIDFHELLEIFSTISLYSIGPAIGIYFFGVVFRTFRWKVLLSPVKELSLREVYSIIAIGYMGNNIFPLRAGEFYRAHLLGRREGISRSAVFSSIVLERIFDGMTMLLFLSIVSLLIVGPFPDWMQSVTVIASIIFFVLYFLSFLLVLYPEKFRKLFLFFIMFLPHDYQKKLTGFFDNIVSGLHSLSGIRMTIVAILYSIAAWLCESGMYYFLFDAFDIELSFVAALLLIAVINLGIMVPSSPGYIGTFEWFCIQTLVFLKVNETVSLSYALLLHVSLFFPITLVGIYYFWQMVLCKQSEIDLPSDGKTS